MTPKSNVLNLQKFGDTIAGIRRRNGLSIRDLSKQVGISPATISRVERGSAPDVQVFATLLIWSEQDFNKFIDIK